MTKCKQTKITDFMHTEKSFALNFFTIRLMCNKQNVHSLILLMNIFFH